MEMEIGTFFTFVLDMLSFLVNFLLLSFAASFDLLKTIWSKPDLILTAHELFEEIRDSSVECFRFVMPAGSLPLLHAKSASWTRITSTWKSARTFAIRLRLRTGVTPALETGTLVLPGNFNSTEDINSEYEALVAPPNSLAPIQPPPMTVAPTASSPFKLDLNFTKPVEQPTTLSDASKPTSRSSTTPNTSSRLNTRLVRRSCPPPPPPSMVTHLRRVNSPNGPAFGSKSSLPAVTQTTFQQDQLFYLQHYLAVHQAGEMVKMQARALAVERIRMACVAREREREREVDNARARAEMMAGMSISTRRQLPSRTAGKPTKSEQKKEKSENVPVRVKQEEQDTTHLVRPAVEDKENQPSKPTVETPPPTPIQQKATTEKKEKKKAPCGRRRAPRRATATTTTEKPSEKPSDDAKKESKNHHRRARGGDKSKKSKSTVIPPAVEVKGFQLRPTAPEFHMRKMLGDKTNA